MTTERMCGGARNTPIPVLADRAARWVMEYATPRAVTIDPEGRVWVEPVEEAAESDLVGVYTRSLGLLELSRRLTDDLRWEASQRSFRPVRRRVVGRGRVAREAA